MPASTPLLRFYFSGSSVSGAVVKKLRLLFFVKVFILILISQLKIIF